MLLLGSFAVAAHALVAPGSQAAIAGLMKKHDPILLYVQNLLSESTAEDAGALYAWCRRLDQIVDDPPAGSSVADTRAALDEWAARLEEAATIIIGHRVDSGTSSRGGTRSCRRKSIRSSSKIDFQICAINLAKI